MLSGHRWYRRVWQGCHVGPWIMMGDSRSRVDSKSDHVFVISGLVPVCGIAVDILLFLECVSLLLVATTKRTRQTVSSGSGPGFAPPTGLKSKNLATSRSFLAASDAVVGSSCMMSGRLLVNVSGRRWMRRRRVLWSSFSPLRPVFSSCQCWWAPFVPPDGSQRQHPKRSWRTVYFH